MKVLSQLGVAAIHTLVTSAVSVPSILSGQAMPHSDRSLHPASNLLKRSTSTGCVQAHCYEQNDPIGGDCMTVQVYHNKEYIFDLYDCRSPFTFSDQTHHCWTGVKDVHGYTWDFEIYANCDIFCYANQNQASHGFYPLTDNGNHFDSTDCDGNGKSKCLEYEAAYGDNSGVGAHYPHVVTCGYKSRYNSPYAGAPVQVNRRTQDSC